MSDYRLTKEGREYLEKGLPEKNLVDLLKKGALSFDEARKNIENFDIALQWVKKKGMIEIEKGLIHLSKEESFPEQEALEKISKEEDVDESLLNVLIERKLVEKIRHDVEALEKEIEGKEISELTPQMLKTGLWKKAKGFKSYDISIEIEGRVNVVKKFPGKIQPYRQVLEEIREKLIGMGFAEVRSSLVELSFWNFDALFMPQDHPARQIHDILLIKDPKYGKISDKELWKRVEETHKNGWITGSKGWRIKWDPKSAQRLLARSHDTGVSARILSNLKRENLPAKFFFIPRVFRQDVIDAKHLAEFDQCAGIAAGEGLTLRHLLGFLKEIAISATGSKEVRFKPTYYPFTEPSVEGYVKHPKLGWVEFGGAGIFRPEMTVPLGVEVPVIAWGIGIGRLAMIKLGIDDIRQLYSEDIKWLREKPLVK